MIAIKILFLFYKLERQPYTVLVLEVLLLTVNFRLVKERHMAGLIHRDVGQIVLAGDHKQLGPVLQSAAARFVYDFILQSATGWLVVSVLQSVPARFVSFCRSTDARVVSVLHSDAAIYLLISTSQLLQTCFSPAISCC